MWSTLFSLYWDVVMDWGFSTPLRDRGGKFVRQLATSSALILVAFDAVMRCHWIFSSSVAEQWLDASLIKPLVEIHEVERRVVWALFRVEWEALKLGEAGGKAVELPRRMPTSALRDL